MPTPLVSSARVSDRRRWRRVTESCRTVMGDGSVGGDAYTAVVGGLLFPLHERLKGHDTLRRLRELERSQWWDGPALAAFQVERLRRFLAGAGSRVPYYRDLYRRTGFQPESVRGIQDLTALPILTKVDIRANQSTLVANGARHLTRFSTGGSTGEPLQFLVGPARVSSDVAARCRAMQWWGVRVGDPEIVLWGSPIEVTRQDRVRAIRDRLFRSTLLSAVGMTPERLDGYLDTLERVRPVQIFSHASALLELTRHAERRRRNIAGLRIRVAFVTSEQLYDHQRKEIERVLGCRVADGYGGRDSGFVAHECPEGGMHLTAEDVVVEIVDEGGSSLPHGRAGEIIVTHLATGDFPFIRYRTGDVGVLHDAPCTCGRGLPLLREIHGRADDLLLSLDGARIPGQAIVHLLRSRPELQAFKIVQETRDLLRILLVKTAEFPAGTELEIVRGVRARLGEGMHVDFESVAEIPRDASGKYRTVVSRVGGSPTLEASRGEGDDQR